MRTWIVAIGSATIASVATSLAIRGTWWPLAIVAVVQAAVMVWARYLTQDIRKLDAEIAAETRERK